MPDIHVDFDVFKELTNRRPAEEVTYNDVIRDLLRLPKAVRVNKGGGRPWTVSDTTFPAGTEFSAEYKGKRYSGIVIDGKLELSNGNKFATPSAAAMHLTGTNVNGWRFWKCRTPGASEFVPLERLRGKAH